MNKTELAKFYFDNNITIFKLQQNSKRSITPKWTTYKNKQNSFYDSYYIPYFVRHKGNIAINCETSNLIVVDCDVKNEGIDGIKNFKELFTEEEFKIIENTFTVFTPSKGLHYYFKTSKLVNTTHSKLTQGVDVQCIGAYIVAPPSIIDGNEYTIISHANKINPIPDFLLNKLLQLNTSSKTHKQPTVGNIKKTLINYINAPQGQRNAALNLFLYTSFNFVREHCLSKSFSYDFIIKIVHDVAISQQWETYNEQEFNSVIKSVFDAVQNKPIIDISDFNLASNIQYVFDKQIYRIPEFPSTMPYVYYKDGIWINDIYPYNLIDNEYIKYINILTKYLKDKEEELQKEIDDNIQNKLIKEISNIQQSLNKLKSQSKINNVITRLNHSKGFTKSFKEFDPNQDILILKNGVYNFKDKKFYDHSPDYLATKKINLNYNPSINDNCKFIKLIKNMLLKQEEQEFLLLCLGYGLTSLNHWKKFFIFQGVANSGKSGLMTWINNILNYGNEENGYIISIDPYVFERYGDSNGQAFQKAEMKGKRVGTVADLPRGYNLKESLVKQITGNDTISGRLPKGRWMTFKPTIKIYITSNHEININDTDKSIWDRIILFKFNNVLKNIDRSWEKKLTEKDYEEALNVLLIYAQKAYDLGDLDIPKSIEENTIQYRDNQDTSKYIIDNYFHTDQNVWTDSDQILNSFNLVRKKLGVTGNINYRTLKTELTRLGFQYKRSNGRSLYYGIMPQYTEEEYKWKTRI